MQSSVPSVSAAEAALLLGVKAQTLYAYASRGLLRRLGTGKRRRYLLEDVERLQARQRARSGHGPVAAAALSFGEPVLDTRITGIDERGPRYRGLLALDLAREGLPFEAVAELLWRGELPATPPRWQAWPLRPASAQRVDSLETLLVASSRVLLTDALRHQRSSEAELQLGRRLVQSLALLVSGGGSPDAPIARLIARRGRRVSATAARAALDQALIVLADHELNASSFAARIAASTDASLPCCVLAALSTLSGPRHGGACDRVEALLDEASSLRRPEDVIERRAKRGEVVPGFGHALYPQGDPRAQLLLQQARALGRAGDGHRGTPIALTVARALQTQNLLPTVDYALVTLARALGLPRGFASLLFALGRSAGWIAHVLEQRGSGAVLRPRARYVGA